MHTGFISLEVKRRERGANLLPHVTPRFRKSIAISLLPLSTFMACSRLIFTFTFGQNSIHISAKRAVFRDVSFVKISVGTEILYLRVYIIFYPPFPHFLSDLSENQSRWSSLNTVFSFWESQQSDQETPYFLSGGWKKLNLSVCNKITTLWAWSAPW